MPARRSQKARIRLLRAIERGQEHHAELLVQPQEVVDDFEASGAYQAHPPLPVPDRTAKRTKTVRSDPNAKQTISARNATNGPETEDAAFGRRRFPLTGTTGRVPKEATRSGGFDSHKLSKAQGLFSEKDMKIQRFWRSFWSAPPAATRKTKRHGIVFSTPARARAGRDTIDLSCTPSIV
ncbi:unnamed protein product [Durusdinium trenchii]|uniref:Uncharacterized protein n=1 Tax=Durusdinium trenchii TaxID=1381693 RepID=A0ABP0R6C0_9DINO